MSGTVSSNDRRTGTLALALVLYGCGTVQVPPPPGEAPLVRAIEAHVGTTVTAEARNALVAHPLMRMAVGQTSAARVEQAFAALFAGTIAVPDWPPWRSAPPAVDGVIELQRVEATLVLGSDTGDNPDVASVAFHICLYSPGGTEVRCWDPAASYSSQRRPFDCVNLERCVTPLMETALREATARFLLEAERDPVLRDWAAGLPGRAESP